MLKNRIDSKKLSIFEYIYITYYIFILLLLPSIPIFFAFDFIIKKYSFLSIFLSSLIYLLIYCILQKVIYKKLKINIRILISYLLLFAILHIPYFSFLLLFIPIMFLYRTLNIKDTLHFSLELVRNHLTTILFVYILNILIISMLLSIILILKIKILHVNISTQGDIFTFIVKNATLLSYYSAINFAISSFLLYKNFEQNDIIKGGSNG